MKDNTRYTTIAIALHWIVAVGLMVNVAIGLIAESLPEEHIRFAINSHKSIGITLLGFALLRLLWRFTHRPPEFPRQQAKIEKFLAHATHAMLYLLILLIPLSGWMHDSAWKAAAEVPMHWFGLFEWPRIAMIMNVEPERKEMLHSLFGSMHTLLSYALYGLVLLHVAAALKHNFSKIHRVRGRGILG